MKCPNCGKENEKDAKFCAVCGSNMAKTVELEKIANSGKMKQKRRKRIFIGISGAFIIVAVIIAGIWIIKGKQVKKQYENHLASGQKYLEELDYESAEDSYLKAIEIDPKEPEPYRKLIDTYVAQEKYDDAVKIARKAQRQVPKEEKQEFEKLEQEYDSVIDYEWVVDPTIEADDIYYVVSRDYGTYAPNELLKQEEEYAIIQKDGAYGLIDIQGEMNGGLEYKNIYNIPAGYVLERIEPRYISEISYEADQDILYRTTKEITYLEGMGSALGVFSSFYWYNGQLHNKNENSSGPEMSPIKTLSVAIPVREHYTLYDPWNSEETWENIKSELYGVCKDGSLKTDFIYDHLGSVSDGVMAAEKDGKWGYINEEGETVIPFEYDASWGKGFAFDLQEIGNSESEEAPFCYAASEGFIPLVKNGQWKLVNTEGETVIPCGIFEAIRPVYNGKCWVEKNGKWGVIQITEKEKQDFKTNFIGMWKGELTKNSDFINDGEYADICTVELKEDGTIISQCHRSTDTGTYEIVGENTIKATFDQNYYEAPGIERMFVEGYSYTVLYTYKEQENMLYAEYDDNFSQMGYQTKQKVMFTR